MGWLTLLVLALAAFALLWLIGFPRRLWTIPATALTLGAAGYAWQGSPGLAGSTPPKAEVAGEVDPGLVALREAMFGRFNYSYSYFMAADGMARAGSPEAAAKWLMVGTRNAPQDAGMWTGLGLALAEMDGGQISPASRFAFDRALALSPSHPGPPFFLGLAHVRANQFGEARQWWTKALELSPPGALYREELEVRLALLDRFLEEQAAQAPPPAP